jgi:phosphoribosylformylglycinamidine synthase
VDRAGGSAHYVWHRDTDMGQADVVLIPGGFAYGDYLRAGAIARFSPVMGAVMAHAEAGGPVVGICNGFQVLCEAGLLPGALMRNGGLRFLSRPVDVRVEQTDTPCTGAYAKGAIISVPVAHGEGRYVASDETLRELEDEGRVVFRYVGANPNGSMANIAGIANRERNVVGLMPHPERAADPLLRNESGAGVFTSLMQCVQPLRGGSA